MRIFLFFVVGTILFSSCTLQKRSYRKGYYINWKNSKHNSAEVKASKEIEAQPQQFVTTQSKNTPIEIAKRPVINFKEECNDVITLRNGEEIKAKVLEITKREIKYKDCDDADGAVITLNISNVFMVKYANGTKEIFKEECNDSVFYRSGSIVRAKVTGITETEIKFKRCANITGPEIAILKSSVSKIKYADGEVVSYKDVKFKDVKEKVRIEIIASLPPKPPPPPPVSIYAEIALVFAVLGIVFLGIPSLLAIVFAIIALRKINKNPDKLRGQDVANAAILLGVMFVFLWGIVWLTLWPFVIG